MPVGILRQFEFNSGNFLILAGIFQQKLIVHLSIDPNRQGRICCLTDPLFQPRASKAGRGMNDLTVLSPTVLSGTIVVVK